LLAQRGECSGILHLIERARIVDLFEQRVATRKPAPYLLGKAYIQGIPFRVDEPQKTEIKPKAYADNFKFGRLDRWTH